MGKQWEKITCDSREITEGSVFVAIKGEHSDGNKYISQAIENGAVLVVTDDCKQPDELKGISIMKVADARQAFAQMSAAFYGNPHIGMKFAGVTGTNGKSTITQLLFHILLTAQKKVGIFSGMGGLGIQYNDTFKDVYFTSPPSDIFFDFLYQMKNGGIKTVVSEVSSHSLDQNRMGPTRFNVAAVTNITPDHLDYHITMDNYIKAKAGLLNILTEDACFVYNADDENVIKMIEDMPEHVQALSLGFGEGTAVTAENMLVENDIAFKYRLNESLRTVSGKVIEPLSFGVSSVMLGQHNIFNSLVAMTMALYLDIDQEAVAEGLSTFSPPVRRLNTFHEGGYWLIDDYAHNPDGMRVLCEAIAKTTGKKYYFICAIRGSRGVEVNREITEVMAKYLKEYDEYEFITTSTVDYMDDHDWVLPEEKAVVDEVIEQNGINHVHFDKLDDAIDYALSKATENDPIVVYGSQGMNPGIDVARKLIGEKYSD
jgi:UDP-N-acetylmuramoyl-L-alanyl-D-glutamate--2,6-diaminopimelate ligase